MRVATTKKRLTIVSVFLSGIAVTATPAMASPAFEYDCDTASGSFSELKQAGANGLPIAVKGSVTPLQFRENDRFVPAAAISVKSGTDNMVMLRVTAMERDKGPLTLQLLTLKDGNQSEEDLATVPIDQATKFAIAPSARGLTVTLGNTTREVAFDKTRPSATAVTCSTGEFLFSELSFGN